MRETIPRIVIVGGGFGGLAAAKALQKTAAGLRFSAIIGNDLAQAITLGEQLVCWPTGSEPDQSAVRVGDFVAYADEYPTKSPARRSCFLKGDLGALE